MLGYVVFKMVQAVNGSDEEAPTGIRIVEDPRATEDSKTVRKNDIMMKFETENLADRCCR